MPSKSDIRPAEGLYPKLSVSLGLWQDRPADEVVTTAELVDELGFHELWIGEMATYDAFTLATAVGLRPGSTPITVGPLSVHVRDPMSIALGVASVADLTKRQVGVALGTSSPIVVEEWHGRTRHHPAVALAESAGAVRSLLEGRRTSLHGSVLSTNGYRLRLPLPQSSLTVAAFGPEAIRVAAETADRLVINLVTPASADRLIHELEARCRELGRPRPAVCLWAVAAFEPSQAAVDQLRRGIVPYLGVPGYAEMFEEAGFGSLVSLARSGAHPRELFEATPAEVAEAVGIVGGRDEVRTQLTRYRAVGVDEIALVPSSTDTDPFGRRTLTELGTSIQ